jgi:hypothetical protein
LKAQRNEFLKKLALHFFDSKFYREGVKYRTKLTIAFVSLAILSTALGLILVSISTKKLLFNEMRSKVLTLAATAASGLDGSLFKNLDMPGVQNTPQYLKAQKALRIIREANRRNDLFVEDVYTMAPSTQKPGEVLYGVDAAEDPTQTAKPGEVVISGDLKEIATHLNVPYVDREVSRDPWGLWLSAFAPIKDENGNYVATLGIDISAAALLAPTTHTRRPLDQEPDEFDEEQLLPSGLLTSDVGARERPPVSLLQSHSKREMERALLRDEEPDRESVDLLPPPVVKEKGLGVVDLIIGNPSSIEDDML